MLPFIGNLSLIIALIFAASAIIIPLISQGPTRFVGNAVIGQFIFSAGSLGILIYGYIISDFCISNVYHNSHISKPLIYKIAGAWANHEGSILLWVNLLAMINIIFLIFSKLDIYSRMKILQLQSLIFAGIIGFIIFVSNPFNLIEPTPISGKGLNPLLQDIGLAMHPPALYLGYVCSSVPFATFLWSLIKKEFPQTLAIHMHSWILATWSFLTIGIGLGSSWAYRELGWGGFWFWDPVENSSLMPWLLATALVHSNLLVIKRGILVNWTILLAIFTFLASLLGTFLVRSGILISVHSFANDPKRGVYILCYFTIIAIISLGIFALRSGNFGTRKQLSLLSQEAGIFFNNLYLFTLFITICLGTIYPILYQYISGNSISVGEGYYVKTFIPITLGLLIFCGFFSTIRHKNNNFTIKYLFITSFSLVFVMAISYQYPKASIISYLALFAGMFLLSAMVLDYFAKIEIHKCDMTLTLDKVKGLSRSYNAMMISHIGLAILAIGITMASTWDHEIDGELKEGTTLKLANYTAQLKGLELKKIHNYVAVVADLYVEKSGNEIGHLKPEQRFYNVEKSQTSESAIHSVFLEDFYISMSEFSPSNNSILVRLFIRPFMSLIWIGAVILSFGGLYSLLFVPRRSL